MNLSFFGDIGELTNGINLLSGELGISLNPHGLPVLVEKSDAGLVVGLKDGNGYIRYSKKHQFFRGLGLFIQHFSEKSEFHIEEQQNFDTSGAMYDCSRNAVLTVDSIKYFIKKMAVMGLNLLMLYTEDVYEVKGQPYFGYLRGRFTQEELKECDDFADCFGIEMAPCIQTLAHLEQFLKWGAVDYLKDTDEIVLAGEDTTYALIEDLLKAAVKPFRSRRVHIGMDEAHALGRGRYLDKNGYHTSFEIMENHIRKVVGIAEKLGISLMMWSDMFFRMNNGGGYYNENIVIPQEIMDRVPKGITQVYWDYYHHDEEFYSKYIEIHKGFGHTPVFAGGICTWTGAMVQNYRKTFKATTAALSACRKEGVREVFATVWNDNGGECNYLSTLSGLLLYSELTYHDNLDMDNLKSRFKFCTGADYDAFVDLCSIDGLPGGEDALEPQNPSKYLLWQDLLLGLFDYHIKDLDLIPHYTQLEAKLQQHIDSGSCGEFKNLFAQLKNLCTVLKIKNNMGLRIKNAYDQKDFDALTLITNIDLPELSAQVTELYYAHKNEWFKLYKPFGWEVLDIRYGGLLMRIRSVQDRVSDYLEGAIDKIAELEEKRLPFDGNFDRGDWIGHVNQYNKIVTPNILG